MPEVVAELRKVTKVYGRGPTAVVALRDVDLRVEEGEVLIIMGPSGSGKTTLLNILGTLDKPTSGRVILCGTDVTDLPEKELTRFRLEHLGFVFQFYNLIPTLTALENVMLPMILLGRHSMNYVRTRALALLKIVGLEERAHCYPQTLSGGEQQRVAIARALANNPDLILMDEPTGAIDLESTVRILQLIKFLNRYLRTTFVIVTHNPEVALIGTRVLYLRGGVLREVPELPTLRGSELEREPEELRELLLTALEEEVEVFKKLVRRGVVRSEDVKRWLRRVRYCVETLSRSHTPRHSPQYHKSSQDSGLWRSGGRT